MKNSISVRYEGPLNTHLDERIEEALESVGFRRWASGMDMEYEGREQIDPGPLMRDIAFEVPEDLVELPEDAE